MKNAKRVLFVFLLVMFVVGCAKAKITEVKSKNEVEEAFVIHAQENGYSEFVEHLENEVSKNEYEQFMKSLQNCEVELGLKKLKYSSISGNAEYCYMNGRYTIPYSVRLTVEWAENIEIDAYNGNFKCNRHFVVQDSTKKAYMLISGDNGKQLICIVPDDLVEENIVPEYTKEGFQHLYNSIDVRKSYVLTTIMQNQMMTEEQLQELQDIQNKYKDILEYEQQVAKKDKSYEFLKENEFSRGLIVIFANEEKESKWWYEYHNRVVRFLSEDVLVKWSQNLIENTEEICTYEIVDQEQDAFALLWSKNGFCLIHIKNN